MQETVFAWHFSDGKLRFDYSDTPVTAGLDLQMDDELIPGKKGFHAALRPLEALKSFAVRPNERKIVSRVRLYGKILPATHPVSGRVASKREHLWVADAALTLEKFGNEIIHMLFSALSSESLSLYPQIDEMINLRRKWLEGEAQYSNLEAIENHLPEIASRESIPRRALEEYASTAKYERTAFYVHNWEQRYRALPDEVSRQLSKVLKRDTQYFALEVPPLLNYTLHTIRCYHGWRLAWSADDPAVTEYVNAYWEYGTSLGNVFFREPPTAYLNQVQIVSHDANTDLHNRLMSLAPDRYSEV